jgi:hypothetical protein
LNPLFSSRFLGDDSSLYLLRSGGKSLSASLVSSAPRISSGFFGAGFPERKSGSSLSLPGQCCRSKSICCCCSVQRLNLVVPTLADWSQVRASLSFLTRMLQTRARQFCLLLWHLCCVALKRAAGIGLKN